MPAVVGAIGLQQIFATGWPLGARLGAALVWVLAALVVAWFATYRWGDEHQRRDIRNAMVATGRLVGRVRGAVAGDSEGDADGG